jgi:hypothetical protein
MLNRKSKEHRMSSDIFAQNRALFCASMRRGGGNCFDCFPDFWHVFWRFLAKWAGGTIEN